MVRLRLLIIGLAIWLIVLFNMARPDIFLGHLDLTIQLSPVVYIIASIAVIVILLLPDLGQSPIWAVFIPLLIIYGISRFVLTPIDPLEPKHSLYFIITEILILFGTVYSTRLVSLAVSNFEKAVENVIVGPVASRVLPKSEAEETINAELYRARMFNRSVSLIHMDIASLPDMQPELGAKISLEVAFQRRYIQNQIAHIIETALNRSDIICRYDDDLLVCTPETTYEHALISAHHLSSLIEAHIGKRISIGVAVFPTHGFIFSDLVTAAISNHREYNTGVEIPIAPTSRGDTGLLVSVMDRNSNGSTVGATGSSGVIQDRAPKPAFSYNDSSTMTATMSSLPLSLPDFRSVGNVRNAVTLKLSSLINLPHSFTNILPLPDDQRHQRPATNQPDDPDFWVNHLPYQSQTARSAYRVVKRVFDLSAVILTAPFTLPVFALVALLTWLDSGRPIFFAQERTGLGGHRFKMYKFRSMVPNAEVLLRELAAQGLAELDANGKLAAPLKMDKDPRITRLGRILRKTSLDELPQLLNVLRGDMSLVGPRPTSWDVGSYTLVQTERLNARPGITGLWQVYGRGTTSFSGWVKWDVMYFEKMSMSLDLRILLLTVKQVLAHRGAR